MKVLSVRQPWASMIVRGLKRFELRSWETPHRGRLLIHASSTLPSAKLFDELDADGALPLLSKVGIKTFDDVRELPRGAIIGAVDLVEILDSAAYRARATVDDATVTGAPDEDTCYWLLDTAVEFESVVAANGSLRLWSTDAVLDRRLAQRIVRARSARFTSDAKGARPADWTVFDNTEDYGEYDDRKFTPSPTLAQIIGSAPRTQADAVRDIWGYIVKNGLRDPKHERMVIADERLLKLTRRARFEVFELSRVLLRHLM